MLTHAPYLGFLCIYLWLESLLGQGYKEERHKYRCNKRKHVCIILRRTGGRKRRLGGGEGKSLFSLPIRFGHLHFICLFLLYSIRPTLLLGGLSGDPRDALFGVNVLKDKLPRTRIRRYLAPALWQIFHRLTTGLEGGEILLSQLFLRVNKGEGKQKE